MTITLTGSLTFSASKTTLITQSVTPATATLTDTDSDENNLATYTFSGMSLGSAFAGRVIVAAISTRVDNGVTISGVTIGGVSATQAALQSHDPDGGDDDVAALYAAAVPTGTTGDVVVSLIGTGGNCQASVYSLDTVDGVAAFDSDSDTADPGDMTIDVPEGGVVIGVSCSTLGAESVTWTGLTEDVDTSNSEMTTHSAAHIDEAAAETGRAVQASEDGAPARFASVVASWSPA